MAARRLILAMLFLLVLSSIIVALIPVESDRSDGTSTTSTTTATPAADEGKLIIRQVSADAQKPAKIKMKAGDQLRLTVTSPVPNVVEIEEFGGFEDVDPNFPAKFDLLPLEPGEFPVRLLNPAGLVATIEVTE